MLGTALAVRLPRTCWSSPFGFRAILAGIDREFRFIVLEWYVAYQIAFVVIDEVGDTALLVRRQKRFH